MEDKQIEVRKFARALTEVHKPRLLPSGFLLSTLRLLLTPH